MVVVFGNVTSNETTGWNPEPNVRGTWSILSSCIITISLCVWTAVHLNLPEHKKANHLFWRKTKWLVLGLAAPEIVAYVAWHQRQEAAKLLHDVRVHLGQEAPPSLLKKFFSSFARILTCGKWDIATGKGSRPTSPAQTTTYRSSWTLVHGFYAAMGGFALDSSVSEVPFLPGSRVRAALTPEGIRFLLKHEPNFLPEISEDQIRDKSKADGLKKFLVCAQALWFCMVCISRLAESLPISLLELNTFGHALCTLLIYVLWWDKPLDVEEPTLIQDEKLYPIFAYSWMSSKISAKGYRGWDVEGFVRDEFDCIWPYREPVFSDLRFADNGPTPSPAVIDPQSEAISSENHVQISEQNLQPPIELPKIKASPPELEPYQRLKRRYSATSRRYQIKLWLLSKGFLAPAGLGVRNTTIDHISPLDVSRWRLAYRAITQYELYEETYNRQKTDPWVLTPRLKPRIQNFPSLLNGEKDQLSRYVLWLGFALAGALYGGLHLVGWNAPFASGLEAVLWRISACSVSSTALLFGPVILCSDSGAFHRGLAGLSQLVQLQGPLRVGENEGIPLIQLWCEVIAAAFGYVLVMVTAPALSATYMGSRVFLVVESFKNVANLPKGAFELPDWNSYIPHIG